MRRLVALSLGTALCTIGLTAAVAAPLVNTAAVVDPNIRQPGWSPPKNAWGQPDLSGFWSNATLTPLTRDVRLVDKATLTAAEAKTREKVFAEGLAARDAESDPNSLPGNAEDKAKDAKLIAARPDFGAAGGDVGGYNTFWLDPGTHLLDINGQYRTAIVTTSNGQVPPRKDGQRVGGFGGGGVRDVYDSYENRPLSERCISFGRNAPLPMLPNGYYNNNYNIVQTADPVRSRWSTSTTSGSSGRTIIIGQMAALMAGRLCGSLRGNTRWWRPRTCRRRRTSWAPGRT